MTAIIGILNKTTVALAADSAATVGPDNNSKVYNNANKLFNLTHNNPVGIAIHGMSEVMGIPWETIIKMYRQQFSHKGFDTLTEYGDDFLRFLGVLLVKHTTQEEQLEAGRSIILGE
jgi:ATP-dependent protease HslVU (ClpYQ) peptidase subunit